MGGRHDDVMLSNELPLVGASSLCVFRLARLQYGVSHEGQKLNVGTQGLHVGDGAGACPGTAAGLGHRTGGSGTGLGDAGLRWCYSPLLA